MHPRFFMINIACSVIALRKALYGIFLGKINLKSG